MPELTITTSNKPGNDWVAFARAALNPSRQEQRIVESSIRAQFAANFTRQGSGDGPWAQLADATAADRARQGYGPRNPILQRTGRLRGSWVNSDRADSGYELNRTSQGWEMLVGSDYGIARYHELGTSRMPARKVARMDNGQGRRIADALDRMLDRIADRTIGK